MSLADDLVAALKTIPTLPWAPYRREGWVLFPSAWLAQGLVFKLDAREFGEGRCVVVHPKTLETLRSIVSALPLQLTDLEFAALLAYMADQQAPIRG